MGLVLTILGLLIEPFKWMAHTVSHLLGFSYDPQLEIRAEVVAPDVFREHDWLHVEVENVGFARSNDTHPANGCRVEAEIDGWPHVMLWEPEDDSLPKIQRDIRLRWLARIPLAFRSTSDGQMKYGSGFRKNVCHITGKNFLSQQFEDGVLKPGEHQVTITVHYDPGRRVQNWFILTVPEPSDRKPLMLLETPRKKQHHGKRLNRRGQLA